LPGRCTLGFEAVESLFKAQLIRHGGFFAFSDRP
jgi:hypothetical protein